MRTIGIGYGFIAGVNTIYKSKVQEWCKTNLEINWKAYVWYIAQYVDVDDFGKDWIKVKIWDRNQREKLYQYSKKYDNQLCSYNYEIDIKNSLYMTQHRGYERNKNIIVRLVNDK